MSKIKKISNNKKINNQQKKAALITGGAKRIGREIAIFLAKQGYDIAVNYLSSKSEALDLAKEIKKKYSVNCEIFKSDLADLKQNQKLIDDVFECFPHLNLLVNNASIFNKSNFLSESKENIKKNLNIHFLSPLFLSQEFAKKISLNLAKDHQIINIIDKNSVRYDTQYFSYLLSKKNLFELTKMLALQLSPNIRVNGISPGFILDPIDQNLSKDEIEKMIKKIPLKRKGNPENIIQTVDFFLKNNFISGQIISVDGAASLNHAG
jgi:NAD(P)-dependent dehydrogenase (short-subunit alcohol dehydrogenase family)